MTRLGWRPTDVDKYKREFDSKLERMNISMRLETKTANIDKKVEELELAMRETVALCEHMETS
eukprot:4069129-Karenia_brevis.AAC.1